MRNRITSIEKVKASCLKSNPRNWRRHPKRQRDAMSRMLSEIGNVGVLSAIRDSDGQLVLVDGHLRAGLHGDDVVEVAVLDLNQREADLVLATHDPIGAMAFRDNEALSSLLAPFNSSDLAGFLWPDKVESLPEEKTLAAPSKKVERGQVYQMGIHRLMCGDSKDGADVERLLDGAEPRLLVTDPPYGVDYDAAWRETIQLQRSPGLTRRTGMVVNDNTAKWAAAIIPCAEVIYAWSPMGDNAIEFGRQIQQSGFSIRAQIIWRKDDFILSRGHYNPQHELCFYAVRNGKTAMWTGSKRESTVWDISWDKNIGGASGGHSTQKPVACMERPLRNHEGAVYDPFVGSGTTIIAAENQERSCYAMEILPDYVGIAIARWEAYTGGKSELIR